MRVKRRLTPASAAGRALGLPSVLGGIPRRALAAPGAAQAAVRAPALARVPAGATAAAAAGVPAAVPAAPAMVWAAATAAASGAAAAALAVVAVARPAAVPLVRAAPVPAILLSAGWDRRIPRPRALRERGRNLLPLGIIPRHVLATRATAFGQAAARRSGMSGSVRDGSVSIGGTVLITDPAGRPADDPMYRPGQACQADRLGRMLYIEAERRGEQKREEKGYVRQKLRHRRRHQVPGIHPGLRERAACRAGLRRPLAGLGRCRDHLPEQDRSH